MSEVEVRPVGAVVDNVAYMSAPKGFLVELHLVALHTAHHASTKLTVAQRQRRCHPNRSGLRVPKCVGVLGFPSGGAADGNLAHGIGHDIAERHLCLSHKLQGVVDVALCIEAQLATCTEAAPLVQVGIAVGFLVGIDFIAAGVGAVGGAHNLKRCVATRRSSCRLELSCRRTVEHHLSAACRQAVVLAVDGLYLPQLHVFLRGNSLSGLHVLALAHRREHGHASLHLYVVPVFVALGAYFGKCSGRSHQHGLHHDANQQKKSSHFQ